MENKKIKSVKRNGINFNWSDASDLWQSNQFNDKHCSEFISTDVILNCSLFEIEYEEIPFDPEIEELRKQLQYCTEGLEKIAAKYGGNK